MNLKSLQRILGTSPQALASLQSILYIESLRLTDEGKVISFPGLISGGTFNRKLQLKSDWPIFSFNPFLLTPTFWLKDLSTSRSLKFKYADDEFELIGRNYGVLPFNPPFTIDVASGET